MASFAPCVSPGPYWLSAPVWERRTPIRSCGFAAAVGVKSPPMAAAMTTTTITIRAAITIHNALLFGAGVGAAAEEDDCSSIITPAHMLRHGFKRSGGASRAAAFWCNFRTSLGGPNSSRAVHHAQAVRPI